MTKCHTNNCCCKKHIKGNLVVDCDTKLKGDLEVKGDVIIDGTTILNGPTVANGPVTINNNLTVNGDINGNDISVNTTLCLNDQSQAPSCPTTAEGCLWVASSTTSNPAPPQIAPSSANVLHFQDSSCRDNIINSTPTDPFYGYWVMINKGRLDQAGGYDQLPLMFLDTTKTPIAVTYYGGIIDNFRELNPLLEFGMYLQFKRTDPQPPQGPTLESLVPPPASSILSTKTLYLTLQPNGKQIIGAATQPTSIRGSNAYYFQKLDYIPVIRPFSDQIYGFNGLTSTSDPNDPVFMFDEFVDYNLTNQPMTNINIGYNIPNPTNPGTIKQQYPGYLALRDIQNKLKTTGITYTSNVTRIQVTVKNGGPTVAPNSGTPWIATTAQPVGTIYMTVIETDIPHHVNRFSTVTLSGFVAPLTYLNGNHVVLLNDDTWTQDTDSNFMNPTTRKFRFTIEADTGILALAPDSAGYVNFVAPLPQATVTIGPITPGSEYKKLIEVQFDFFYNMFEFSTHSVYNYYRPNNGTAQLRQRSVVTFADLQTRLRAGTATVGTVNLRTVQHGSAMSVNLFITQNSTGAQPTRQIVPLNNPFGIAANPATPIWDYNISIRNYLDPTPGFEARNLWWRLVGAAITLEQQIIGNTYYPGQGLGQTFESVTNAIPDATSTIGTISASIGSPIINGVGTNFIPQMIGGVITFGGAQFSILAVNSTIQLVLYTPSTLNAVNVAYVIDYFSIGAGRTVIPNPGAPIAQQYFQLNNGTRNNFNSIIAQRFLFARITPSYTAASPPFKNVGYIRIGATTASDPLAGMSSSMFAPQPPAFPIDTTQGGTNPTRNIQAEIRVWATGMNYIITTLGCTSLIVDNRAGVGGLFLYSTLSNLIGDDRPEVEAVDAYRDTGFSSLLVGPTSLTNRPLINDTLLRSREAIRNTLPSKAVLFYGANSVFRGGKVYCLTDSRASSGSDLATHYFLGTNSPPTNRNLGGGVTTKIFGDSNGILSGGAGGVNNQTTKARDFIVTNALGLPIPFNAYSSENLNTGLGKFVNEPVSLNNRGPWMYTDLPNPNFLGIGGTTGNSFIPWMNAWENVAYPDLGAPGFGPLFPRLPGDTRPLPQTTPLPLFPAQPTAASRLNWRDSWLEQTVYDAITP